MAADDVKWFSTTRSGQEIETLIRARYPLIYVVSSEERRIEEELVRVVREGRQRQLLVWTCTGGFRVDGDKEKSFTDIRQPERALEFIYNYEADAVFLLKDFHPYFTNPDVVRRLRDLNAHLANKKQNILLLSPVLKVPAELEKDLAVVDFDPPDRGEVERMVDRFLRRAPRRNGWESRVEVDEVYRDRVIEACLGLTADESAKVLAKSWVRHQELEVETILEEKRHIIRKSGILEYFQPTEKMDDIGGLENLKVWLRKRQHAFSQEARRFGLPLPRGILLIGIPGCGKSLTAKAVGAEYKMPLLRLDVGKVMAGIVGSSEENMRRAIRTAEAVAPSILWLDEMEKGFSGTRSSSVSDAGTTARVFGSFVTWLQEKTSPVFVIATANDVSQLPPELMRKGRFDEIFFVDLPSPEERRKIFEIHISKKGRDPSLFDLNKLVAATHGFSGSEIEQVVISALYDVYDQMKVEKRPMDIDTDALLRSIQEIIPLSYTMKETIDSLREWARSRARLASEGRFEEGEAAERERALELA